MVPRQVLFVHQNFPGQYVHLAPALARMGHRVTAMMLEPTARQVPGVACVRYQVAKERIRGGHPLTRDLDAKLLRAEGVARVALQMLRQGYVPDLICVHPGWGESLFLRDIWPSARQLHYVEWFYGWEGHDVTFDPEFPPKGIGARFNARMKNSHLLQALADMDHGISPTHWQCSTVPECFRQKISVVHDGVNTAEAAPNREAVFEAERIDGRRLVLGAEHQVISLVNRNLEPLRGFHVFMRALPELMRLQPELQVVVVGGDVVSYGACPLTYTSWRECLLDEIGQEELAVWEDRLHFVGRVPHAQLMNLFRIVQAHVYLTYPFVLSWSMLEAMACGAPVIGSDTAPVRELIEHGVNGCLVRFFDRTGLVNTIHELLGSPDLRARFGQAARKTIVQRYDLDAVCLPQQLKLMQKWLETSCLPRHI